MSMERRDTNPINAIKGKEDETKIYTQANLTEQDDDVIVAIVEVNLIENKTSLILDIGALRHFCTS